MLNFGIYNTKNNKNCNTDLNNYNNDYDYINVEVISLAG
jgi:hypothetical protein